MGRTGNDDIIELIVYGVLGGLQSIGHEHWADEYLRFAFTDPYDTNLGRLHVEDVWDENGYHLPEGHSWTRTHTRRTFKYPSLSVWGKFATGQTGLSQLFGLELGGGQVHPWFGFFLSGTSLYAIRKPYEGGAGSGGIGVEITMHLPTDYDTNEHMYSVKVNKHNVEYMIDGKLVAVVLLGVSRSVPEIENVQPYAIGVMNKYRTLAEYTAFIEGNFGGTPITIPITPSWFRCGSGDPMPPRTYELYTENSTTKWNNTSLSAVTTSHPVPIWGYRDKTLLFQSNAAGTLDIEVFAGGGWRTYDSISLTADSLTKYVFPEGFQAPLMRCVYTPAGTDTIAVAEVHLA